MRRYRVTPNARSPSDSGCFLRGLRRGAPRPIEASKTGVCEIRNTSIGSVRNRCARGHNRTMEGEYGDQEGHSLGHSRLAARLHTRPRGKAAGGDRGGSDVRLEPAVERPEPIVEPVDPPARALARAAGDSRAPAGRRESANSGAGGTFVRQASQILCPGSTRLVHAH